MMEYNNISLENIDSDIDLSFDSFSVEIKNHINVVKSKNAGLNIPNVNIQKITDSLVSKSKEISKKVLFDEVGTVQHIGNGVANISGLTNTAIDDLVKFQNDTLGLTLNLGEQSTDVILLGNDNEIHGGDQVTSLNKTLEIPVGENLIGRVVNALGNPIDGISKAIEPSDFRGVETKAPGITERAPVTKPLITGVKTIDALFPIGMGQRELIVGDRQTGKTTLAVDAILSQKRKNIKCVYVSIGQKKSALLSVIDVFRKYKAFDYTTIVAATPDDPPSHKYLAPFSGMAIAEYFLENGEDTLIVFDDLSKHADAYREISLLLKRPPGREAYPGDIFYLHARLLERSCKLNSENGGGSITAIPIITMQQGNLSAYIPTNLISICDGQIVLDKNKFNKGIKPAIDIGVSVSRVGGSAQSKIMRKLSNQLKLELSQFQEVERFTQFGTEVDEATKKQIKRGQVIQNLLIQSPHEMYSQNDQLILLSIATKGFLDDFEPEEINRISSQFLSYINKNHSDFTNKLSISDDVDLVWFEKEISSLFNGFSDTLNQGE